MIILGSTMPSNASGEAPSTRTAWKEWLAGASPELMELFQECQLEVLTRVRRRFPGQLTPGSAEYIRLKLECAAELDDLAREIGQHHSVQLEIEDAVD